MRIVWTRLNLSRWSGCRCTFNEVERGHHNEAHSSFHSKIDLDPMVELRKVFYILGDYTGGWPTIQRVMELAF
jgi:hypothetical protein